MEVALIGALIYKLIDFLKFVKDRDWNSVVTQASVWLAGIVVVFLVAATTFGAAMMIPGVAVALGAMTVADKIFVGLMAASLFSAGKDVIKAVDNTQTAKTPPLTFLSQGDSNTTNGS